MYSRELDGQVLTLASSGWTFERLFVLYDRETESVWYDLPSSEGLTCVAGEFEGRVLPEVGSSLRPWLFWRGDNPTTKALPTRFDF